jgi:hypothetical protein
MECVDGSCIDKPSVPIDIGDSVINSPPSDGNQNSGLVVEDCPPGQFLKYGTCITPPPNDTYVNPHPPNDGGCHVNDKPISRWFLLIWASAMAFFIFLRATKGDAND